MKNKNKRYVLFTCGNIEEVVLKNKYADLHIRGCSLYTIRVSRSTGLRVIKDSKIFSAEDK